MEPKEPKKKNRNSAINFPIKHLSNTKKTPQPKTLKSVKVIPTLSLFKEKKDPEPKTNILTLDLLSKKYDQYDLPKFHVPCAELAKHQFLQE